ncbi:MAG: recombination protein RecR [Candidatus Moraniibacteriota bacterium]|nr:MAG: recombination protein RecR [Candidatus Moranbacteria bacterium]
MYPQSFQKCINHFHRLPGIGPKMAERLVLHLYKQQPETIDAFASDLAAIKDIGTCKTCFNIAQGDACVICADSNRDTSKLCIVEEALDIIPIERSRSFDGVYHVLGGTVDKKDTKTLSITHLHHRLATDAPQEIIIATNFTTEGDMTAMYLHRELKKYGITITRLLRGLATGSDIEYADDMTIRSALTHRAQI